MREIDFTQPLSEEDEAYLRQRMTNEQVNHLKAKAEGSQFAGVSDFGLSDRDGALEAANRAALDAQQAQQEEAQAEPAKPSRRSKSEAQTEGDGAS
jgi:hypothetical protein